MEFVHQRNRIVLNDLPKACPDSHAGVALIAMESDNAPRYAFGSVYPQMCSGVRQKGDARRSRSGYRTTSTRARCP